MASTINASTSGGLVTTADTSGVLQLQTANTTAVTIDASQNVGVGVTPSTWTLAPAFELKQSGVGIWNSGSNDFYASNNAYYNGGWKYGTSSVAASQYRQVVGQHQWFTAPSGTAGNAITFTQAMTLDASGNLGIGRTTFTEKLSVQNTSATSTTVGTNVIAGFRSNAVGADTAIDLTDGQSYSARFGQISGAFYWMPGGSTERMRLTSSGELWVAGTTDQGAYNIQCNGTGVWGAGAYVNGSDARIKEEIAPIDSGLDVVQKLNPVTYKYKEDWTKDRSTQTGFIAQELQVALEGKNYVDGIVQQGGSEGYYSVAYQNIIPILTKAIQELKAELDQAKAEIATLKGA